MPSVKLGKGTLKIGATGTEIDVSCQINGARITTNVDTADSITTLCGTTEPGAMTFDYEFTGNINVDIKQGAASLFALSWDEKGTEQAFEFVPNTADGTKAVGTIIITPLDLGADAFGDPLASDFTWPLAAEPTFTYGPPA
jgi:hypothetical protein